jgi:ankyrin repeat protein
MVAAAKGST